MTTTAATTATITDIPATTKIVRPRTGSILRAERIKFWSTRSPWWCMALAAVLSIGFGMLVAGTSDPGENRIFHTLGGMQFAQTIVLVMAAIAVTSEYRFGTIRTTFQAAPNRARVLWTKGALVALIAGVFGEIVAFATFFLARLVANDDVLTLSGATAWRQVAGHGLVYAISVFIALGVGTLVRQTAGAISLMLVWTLLVENLVQLIPNAGDDIYRYMPFVNGNLIAGNPATTGLTLPPLSLWASYGIFVGTALIVMLAATYVLRRRDA
jgi:ABC-2 type transport system permease protein